MTKVSDIHKAVTRQFGDETGAMIEISDTMRWINEGQFQIVRRLSNLISTAPPINVLVGTKTYDLPADFFKAQAVELDGKKLYFVSVAQLATLFPDLNSDSAQNGFPKFFSVQSTGTNAYDITLAPIPGQTGTLTVVYKSRPPIVHETDDDLYLPEEYTNTLITYCLAKAKQMDGDDEGVVAMSAQFKQDVAEDSHDSNTVDDETYPFIRASAADNAGGWGGVY